VKSLERRILVGLALILIALFVGLVWVSVRTVSSMSETYVQTRLEHDAEALVAAFGVNPRGQPRLREGRITPIYKQPLSGHYYVLRLDDGETLRSRSLWDEGLAVPSVGTGAVVLDSVPGPAGQQLLVRAAGYEKSGRRFTLLVAEDLSPMLSQIARYQWSVLLLLAAVLLAAVLLQRWILRRAFRALDEVRADMQRVSTGERQKIETLGPSEIRPLTVELNRLLGQLQDRLRRSRQALGNLAHALKSPLSVLTQQIDALPLPEDARQGLAKAADRIAQLVDRELKRARISGTVSGQRFDPAADVPELIAAVEQVHRGRHLGFTTTLPDHVLLPLDYEDMLELLGNLIDNACQWARGRIDIVVSVDGRLQLTVADDGPGVPADERVALLGRGSRLDEQRPGHGLGLSIVADLVNDYGGIIEFAESPTLGGLEVRVSLPLGTTTADD